MIALIIIFAPAEHAEKPLSTLKYYRNKKVAVVEGILISGIIIVLFRINRYYSFVIFINFIEIIISMLIGKGVKEIYERKMCKNHCENG